MKTEYTNVKWEQNDEWLQRWKDGRTGYPIVDAGMRHLNKTGSIPNRERLVVAHFLVKDLMIDWHEGEKYFAQRLVDYDPCQNNGGWQWCAGTGVDSKPYLRIYNPVLQSKHHDENCEYIWTWIPELREVPKEHVHDWENFHALYKGKGIDYPDPIVKHAEQRKKCIEMFGNAKKEQQNELEPGHVGEKMDEEAKKDENEQENIVKVQKPKRTTKQKKDTMAKPTKRKFDKKDENQADLLTMFKKMKKTENEPNISETNVKGKISDWFKVFSGGK